MGEVMQDRVARYVELIERADTLGVLCQRVEDEGSLDAICKSLDVPYGRVMRWLRADVARYATYDRALKDYANRRALLTSAVVDAGPLAGEDTQRDKLRTDQSFKLAEKVDPERWGNKTEVTHKGPPSFVVNIIGAPPTVGAVASLEKDVTPPKGMPEDAVL